MARNRIAKAISEETKDSIELLYRKGVPISGITAELGVGRSTVTKVAKERGCPSRARQWISAPEDDKDVREVSLDDSIRDAFEWLDSPASEARKKRRRGFSYYAGDKLDANALPPTLSGNVYD